jgi:O-methyltransferase
MNWSYLSQIAYCNNVEVLKLTERICYDVIKNNILGDFAECGVAYGVHGLIMNECSKGQKVYLFDSFEGIPTHSDEDIEWTAAHGIGEANERKSGVCEINKVKETMLKEADNLDNFVFVKGWFADTLPELKDEIFSVLRLDCDLYSSYMTCFKYMLPRLQNGGWLIIDDWVLSGVKKAITDSGIDLNSFTVENNIAYLKWNNGHH